MKINYISTFVIILIALIIVGCQRSISTYKECVEAGNPIMESYPRQCRANSETFVEMIDKPITQKPVHVQEFQECTSEQKESRICTREWRPVCGIVDNDVRCITEPCVSTNAKTFGNACSACANPSLGYYQGECEDKIFVVCTKTVTGFSAEEFANNNNGICVDVCPGNYDPYVTQIGVRLCIEHYGLQEITKWEDCDRSTNSCNCVKAYETTRGEQIENPLFRCVPNQYAERLLFRSGQERLDEDGKSSVVIA